MELPELVDLDRGHDLPRDDTAIDHALRQGLRCPGTGMLTDTAPKDVNASPARRGIAQLEAVEILHGRDLLVVWMIPYHVPRMPAASRRSSPWQMTFAIFLRGGCIRPGARRGMNGSSKTSGGKAARCIARQRPDDVDDAVAGLVVKLRRFPTDCIAGYISTSAARGSGRRSVLPRVPQPFMNIGGGWQEVMQLERQLSSPSALRTRKRPGAAARGSARFMKWRRDRVILSSVDDR